jgi:hypothetical protein
VTARAPSGEILLHALQRAIRLERAAVLTEEAGGDAADLWVMAAEQRVECGQPSSTASLAVDVCRSTVDQWRGAA